MATTKIIPVFGTGLVVLVLLTAPMQAQPRGGPRGGGGPSPFGGGGGPSPFGGGGFSPFGGGGKSMDPAQLFEFLSKGRGYFLVSDTRTMREPLTQWVKDKGLTSEQITRDQFVTFFNERMKNGFPAPGGGGPFGMKGPGSFPGGPPGAAPTPGGPPAPGAPPSGDEAKERFNQFVEGRFKDRDRNGDGKLNTDEMNDSLRGDLARWDANKDGLIDLEEYKAYSTSRFQQRQEGEAQKSGNAVVTIIIEEELDRRPTIFRAGKLPKELPSWFTQLDTDQDGQVGLYEWRQGQRDLEEFKQFDRNDDGFLTAEEVLRNQNQTRLAANGSNTAPGSPPPFGGNNNGFKGFNGGGPGGGAPGFGPGGGGPGFGPGFGPGAGGPGRGGFPGGNFFGKGKRGR